MKNYIKNYFPASIAILLIIILTIGVILTARADKKKEEEKVQFIKHCITERRAKGYQVSEAAAECQELWRLVQGGYIDE
jgi:hypothetical protein